MSNAADSAQTAAANASQQSAPANDGDDDGGAGQDDEGQEDPEAQQDIDENNAILDMLGEPPEPPAGPTTNTPDPDSDGSEGPSVSKGGGFRPHGGDTGGGLWSQTFPDPNVFGYDDTLFGLGSGGGDEWGTNPHFIDPEDSGPDQGSASSAADAADNGGSSFSGTAGSSNASSYVLPPTGNVPDDWGGNNPHYTPYGGTSWSPNARVGIVAHAQLRNISSTVKNVGI